MLKTLIKIAIFAAITIVGRSETPQATSDKGETSWINVLDIDSAEALADFQSVWNQNGTEITLANSNGINRIVCHLKRRRSFVEWTGDAPLPPSFSTSARSTMMLPNTNLTATISLRRSRQRVAIYVDAQPALYLEDIWDGNIIVQVPMDNIPADGSDGFVQRLAPFVFDDAFMTEGDTPETLQLWASLSGKWGLHAVTGTTLKADAELKRFPKPERSPNFYSLGGSGDNAMIVTGEPFNNHYRLRASVQHNAGTNGIVFLVQEDETAPVRGHAFTVQTDPLSEQLIFTLWRGLVPGEALGKPVESVISELRPGQWFMLEVKIHDDYISCLVDGIEVIHRRLALPPGGLFGLYSHAPGGARFDDVHASTHSDIIPLTAKQLLPWTRVSKGELDSVELCENTTDTQPLFPQRQAWHKSNSTSGVERIFGSTNDSPRHLSLTFTPRLSSDRKSTPDWHCELITGWRNDNEPHYRMTVERNKTNLELILSRHSGATNITVLDRATIGVDSTADFKIELDATASHTISGIINGETVLWSPIDDIAAGASGFYLGKSTQGRISLPILQAIDQRLEDRYEKNNIYVSDPYMRHWASPEGQWLEYPEENIAWYKSDVLSRLQLKAPATKGSQLHMLVPEGETNGVLQLVVGQDDITLLKRAPGTTNLTTVAEIPLNSFPESQPVADKPKYQMYTINLFDSIFALSCETGLVARGRVEQHTAGRRMFMRGMKTADLSLTHIVREPVLDCLFTDSLHDWIIGGGHWEVINRFQCYPEWSHMNGESADSLATLWSKYNIEGDFNIDFFVGTRHGWYNRVGDFNLTVMNSAQTTGSGYSLTTTGWDPNESQLMSRFFRDGKLLAESDSYAAPRRREGNVRKGYEPLIAQGRDVHGAWYTVRLRRIADRITFDFDNDRILDIVDPEPIKAGSFGIWTYRNSIMVARVRVTADSISPRRFGFKPLFSLPQTARPEPVLDETLATVGGWPLQALTDYHWYPSDEISHSLIEFKNADTLPEMRVSSVHGGGAFVANANLPEIAATNILGWTFEVARHPEARFNLHYQLGSIERGVYKATDQIIFGICGTTETRGPRRFAGSMPRLPRASPDPDSPVWTTATAWLPIEAIAKKQIVRLQGFGNLQPSDIQQGLVGNPPGAWFAIRNFRPIFADIPRIKGGNTEAVRELMQTMQKAPAGKINKQLVPPGISPVQSTIEWGIPPGGDIALIAEFSRKPDFSLRVKSTLPWPNSLLTAENVRINGDPITTARMESNELIIPLPRTLEVGELLRLDLNLSDGREFTQMLPFSQLKTVYTKTPPPVLIRFDITNAPSIIENFESRNTDVATYRQGRDPTLLFDGSRQGGYLRFANQQQNDRLRGYVLRDHDIAYWPLLTFRYRGDSMARVSLMAGGAGMIKLSEDNPRSSPVPLAKDLVLDNRWHSWIGNIAAFSHIRPITTGFVLNRSDIQIASFHPHDQTGKYSTLDIDDLTAGPVIPVNKPLVFKATYKSLDKLQEHQYAIIKGTTPWAALPSHKKEAAEWIAFDSSQWHAIESSKLDDGIYHLVTRARNDSWSEVSDLPFLVDKTPVEISSSVVASDRHNRTMLMLNFQSDGAPPILKDVDITLADKSINFKNNSSSRVHFNTNGISFELNWPLILRKEINKAEDGAEFTLRTTGVADAAGNQSQPHLSQIKLDFAADKTPPTCATPAAPTNALWWAPSLPSTDALFTANRLLEPSLKRDKGLPVVALKSSPEKDGWFRRTYSTPLWDTRVHSYLALSVRLAPDAKTKDEQVLFSLKFRPENLPKGANRRVAGGYSLDFTSKTKPDNKVIFGDMELVPGKWNDIVIDVRSFLRDATGLNKTIQLKSFDFVMLSNAPTIEIRAGAIMGSWSEADLLVLRAYDASGIKKIEWQGGNSSPFTAIRPALIKLPDNDNSWLKAIIHDRAGNSTHQYLVPIPPRTTIESELPATQNW